MKPMWKIWRELKHQRVIKRRASLLMGDITGRVIAITVLAAVLAWVGFLTMSCAECERYVIDVSAGSVLNFRAAPSTEGEILYQVSGGNLVTVHQLSPDGEWAKVTWLKLEPLSDPRPAWVSVKFLRPATEAEENEACRDIASLVDGSRQ